MADISDVESALVGLLTSTLYPSGVGPGAVSAVVGPDGRDPGFRIFPGWPVPARLDADVVAGVVNVSVFAQPGLERNVSRYSREWKDQTPGSPTITAQSDGTTVTLGGTVTAGNYVTVLAGKTAFTYSLGTQDTLASVAAGLAAGLPSLLTYVSGNSVKFTGRSDVVVRAAAPGTVIRELKRQQRRFLITVWAPNNALRVATSAVIDPVLASTDFLTLPDLTAGRLTYELANDTDRSTKQGILCRDNYWWVEYATTQVQPGYPVTAFQQSLTTPAPQTLSNAT